MSKQADPEAKVVLLGASSVGKTSIVTRVTSGAFDPTIKPTIGACYASKSFNVEDRTIKLQIWDTAGQERFKNLVPMYYRGSRVALVVFSVADKGSFDDVDFWVQSVKASSNTPPVIFLIANKIDLVDHIEVTTEQGKEIAEKWGAEYFEVSAVTGTNVDDMIQRLAQVALDQVREEPRQGQAAVQIKAAKKDKSGCC